MGEDIVDTKSGRGGVEIRTGIGRKRRWLDEEGPDGHFKFPQARSVKLPHLKQDTDC